jgi:outer membrane receptor protein involved in Fe transport
LGQALVNVFANLGNTFQPAQLDFGPDAQTTPLLKPEFLQSVEAGMKAEGYDGRFDLELTGFFVNFNNRPIAIAVDGQPALADGGKERFRGVELETRFRFDPHVALSLNYTHGSAVYVDSTTVIGSTQVSLAGNRIELVPRDQAQAAVVFGTRNGWYGSRLCENADLHRAVL